MDSVAFHTIEPRRVRASSNVSAAFEELERLAMTAAAHLERGGGIRFGSEVVGVRFRLFNLRGIPAVTAVATYACTAMRTRLKDRNDLAGYIFLHAMTGNAVVFALCGDLGVDVKDSGAGEAQPDARDDQ